MAFNRENFNNVSSGGAGSLRIWSYKSTSDTIATIAASNYFYEMRFALRTNDMIMVVASNGSGQYLVSSAVNATTVTVTPFDTVPLGTITYADIQNVSATDRILGRETAGAGVIEEIVCTAAGRALLDDANAAAQRTTLGAAASGANTDLTSVYLNNTGLKVKDTNASHGLSFVPGSDLTADRVLTITTGDAARTLDISAASVTVSAFGATLTDDADALTARATLGVVIGTNVQAWDADLDTLAALGAAVPRTVAVAVSAAEFAGMSVTPKLLVAAGGANTLHIVHSVVLAYTHVTASYAVGGAILCQYDNTALGAGTAASATIAAATVNAYAANSSIYADGNLASSADTTTVNKGLYLSNQTAPFITGDGTFRIYVTYSTVATV